ncbi:MAG TPA: extracellular solute-binding protein [Dongiaceae bacterium]|jgi:multiple sugar transport system substrate-binding protein|nr:extracellular solute-binding protein [Dongiaceae bacterium]
MKISTWNLALAGALVASLASKAMAGDLVINTDASDPAPKKAWELIVAGFEKENPDIKVKLNTFDHEGFKTSIRNFLSADAPDIVTWYAGNRMAPFVKAKLFADVTDVWTDNKLDDAMKSTAASMEMNGKKWGVPYTYYQWGVYYRKDIFQANGIAVPTKWDEFVAACAKLKAAGIIPIAIGTQAPWPAAGWFDYLDLRVNGYEFHRDLTAGKIPYTDDRVKAVFAKWADLVKPGYFVENSAALKWQDALPLLTQGKAAMFLLGNFIVAPAKEAGLTDANFGFFPFPEITPGVARAEDAPTDTVHMPAKAKHKAEAKKFLAYIARADVQAAANEALGQLPTNNQSAKPNDPFLQAGFDMLSSASALAQFYDRDAPADMAKAGMEGFQQFLAKPDNVDQILGELEKARKRIYK